MTADDQIRDLFRNIACLTLRELVELPEKFGVSTRTGFVLVGDQRQCFDVAELPPERPWRPYHSAGLGCGISIMCLSAWIILSVHMVAS